MCCQMQAPAASLPGKEFPVPGGWVRLRARIDSIILVPVKNQTGFLGCPAHLQVTALTELSRVRITRTY